MSRTALWMVFGLVLAFLLLPIAVVVAVSFNEGRVLAFPPEEWSLTWYRELFEDPTWGESFGRTLVAACVAVALATPIGTLAALSLVRGSYRGKSILRLALMTPLLVPLIVLSVGLYGLYSEYRAIGSPIALGLAHAALALPFVVLVMSAAIQNVDERIEAAARTLGATRWQTSRLVTFPALRGAIGISALLAFIVSFDEVVLALFLSSGGETLPVTFFQYLKTEINPVIAAVSTLLTAGVIAGFAAAGVLARLRLRFARAR